MKLNIIRTGQGKTFSSGSRGRSTAYTFVFALLFVALAAGAYVFFKDLSGPEIVMTPMSGSLSPDQEISLTLTDKSSAIRSVSAVVRHSGKTIPAFDRTFPEELQQQKLAFTLKNAGLKDGSYVLEIVARDTSLAGLGRGNSTTLTYPFVLDSQPPRITLRAPPPSLRRGGSAVFVYSLSEEVETTGIMAADIFFPAFLLKDGVYCCFLAFPIDVPKTQFVPRLMAKDKAGNVTNMGLSIHLQDRTFRADRLNISDSFLNRKAPDFEEILPGGNATPLERYLRINSEVRVQNEKTLRELAARTASEFLWTDEKFQHLPGSAMRAGFGDNRTYFHNDQPIDRQVHMGIDLASVAHAPIPAANDGRVIFAGPLGIFGNLVIVDHGMGLMSLYSHMSQILVSEGESVTKGQTIANTGTTGLAGGDHLHFGILVNGIQVQPLDWLDKNWVRAAITGRIEAALKR